MGVVDVGDGQRATARTSWMANPVIRRSLWDGYRVVERSRVVLGCDTGSVRARCERDACENSDTRRFCVECGDDKSNQSPEAPIQSPKVYLHGRMANLAVYIEVEELLRRVGGVLVANVERVR